mmetsp:Transcript_29032/g.42976  ORF Transcript_29032/g.42976 Transcript_29032/m.42976 type:complete len:101 (+) Transcript_29032:502-804(+)
MCSTLRIKWIIQFQKIGAMFKLLNLMQLWVKSCPMQQQKSLEHNNSITSPWTVCMSFGPFFSRFCQSRKTWDICCCYHLVPNLYTSRLNLNEIICNEMLC